MRIRKRFIIGVFFLALFMINFVIPKPISVNLLSLFWFFFMIGFILIFDAVTAYFKENSFLQEIIKSKHNLIVFVVISVLGGFCVEFVGLWLGKLWIYPYFSFVRYLLIFLPGFALYWLLICESYFSTKSILDRFWGIKKLKKVKSEKKVFKAFGALGLVLFIIGMFLILNGYYTQTSNFLALNDLSEKTSNYKVDFHVIIIIFFSFWFVLEYIEYKRKETSLIKDILDGYLIPVYSIIIGSVALALIMEISNKYHTYWSYINWPFENLSIFGIPLSIFLLWPLHYIAFLSFFRALAVKESSSVWRQIKKKK